MKGGNKKMKRGGTEWHLQHEQNDLKYEGDGGSVYDWRDPNRIKVIDCDTAFDTLHMSDSMKELYMYMYTMEGIHYFKHSLTREYLTTKEL
tara:strand:+ start:57 stop:329 length:273 start_codon:yes stop_codon:yes gene_type:complete